MLRAVLSSHHLWKVSVPIGHVPGWNNLPSASTLTFDFAFPLSRSSGDGMLWTSRELF